MTLRSSLATFVFLVSASAPALAASATPEGAQRLTAVFQAYLGDVPGVLSVAPAGEAYDVRLDLAPYFAKAPSKDFAASITPLAMKIAEQGGGKWLVTQDQPFSLVIQVPGAFDMTVKVGSYRSSGVFDEAIAAFASSTSDFADVAMDQTTTMPGSGPSRSALAVKSIHMETAMSAAASGVDGTTRMEMTGIAQTVGVPAGPGGATPPMDISVTMAKMSQDATVKGLQVKPVMGLLAWFVAHPSPEAIMAGGAEIKSLLRAGLPLFDSMSATGTADTIAAGTPFGPVGIAKASFGLSLSGIIKDGLFGENVSVSGLTLPPGLVPPWAAKLVPTEFNLGFNVSGYDAAAPAALMLDNLDFTADPPLKPELEAPLMKAFLPNGTVKITLEPGKISSEILTLGFEGSMTAGPAALPAGQATVTAKGLDQVMEALQAAPPEMGLQQGVAALIAAKGMAKQDGDGNSVWKIESTAAGTVTINGIDPSKM